MKMFKFGITYHLSINEMDSMRNYFVAVHPKEAEDISDLNSYWKAPQPQAVLNVKKCLGG